MSGKKVDKVEASDLKGEPVSEENSYNRDRLDKLVLKSKKTERISMNLEVRHATRLEESDLDELRDFVARKTKDTGRESC